MSLILKPFCSSRSKMSRGCRSPKQRLGHQDDYQLAEVLSQVTGRAEQPGAGRVGSGERCQVGTSACCNRRQSSEGFGKGNGSFSFSSHEKYACCRNATSCNAIWGEMLWGTGGLGASRFAHRFALRSVVSRSRRPRRAQFSLWLLQEPVRTCHDVQAPQRVGPGCQ